MTTEYTFVVETLMCEERVDDKTNVVSQVKWRFGASDAKNTAIFYGSTNLTYAPNSSFIEYSRLTKENVKTWVETSLGQDGVEKIQTDLSEQLQKMQVATPKQTALPWVN